MRQIQKSTPLKSFTDFCTKQRPTNWNDLHQKGKEVYEETRLHILLEEQGQQCGYTEIFLDNLYDSHIDHFKKRSLFPQLTFDWNNLIVAAKDASFGANYKDNVAGIQISDYQNILNPITDKAEDYFYYNEFGQIEPKKTLNPQELKKAERTIEVFNLKDESLRRRRQDVIRNINSCEQLPKEVLVEIFSETGFKSVVEQYCV
jgi:uncharacterized protein (TIGR02646 family)